jgi:hypothetical protein
MEKVGENRTKYTDEIELNAGILTNFVSKWAKSLYLHRQRRWEIVVEEIKTKAQQRV